MASPPVLRMLIADFLAYGRGRIAAASSLIVASTLLEGAGVLMLVPIISLILGGGAAGEAPGGGGLAGPVFSALGLESSGVRILAVLAVFALLLVLRFVILLYRDDTIIRLEQDFVRDLRTRAFEKLARMPWAEVSALRHDAIGHALVRDVDRSGQGAGFLLAGTIAVVMLAVQGALALVLSPLVTLVVAVLGLALFLALSRLRERAQRHGESLTAEDLALFQSASAFLSGLKPAKAHGLERDYVRSFDQAARRVGERRRAFSWDFSVGRLTLQTASGGIAIVAVLLGIFAIDSSPEKLVVTLIILARLYGPLQGIQNSIQGLRHAAPAYLAARNLAGPPDHSSRADADAAIPHAMAERLDAAPEIEFCMVSWRPAAASAGGRKGDHARAPLEQVSAVIPAGRVTALIGESGAGKSTLCDLAVGLLEPSSGEIRLDGAAREAAAAGRLRASVAYVGQEPFLFEDTLRHNLCWGCQPLEDDEIWQALEIVGASPVARALEGGLDGRIGRDGLRFSGGERQRLRLARALLRRPRLMVLDEATNALDLEAESEVLQAFLGARGGATVVMVSHRPGNLALADHVILLEEGRLAETGPVVGLAADPATRTAALLGQGAYRTVRPGPG